MTIKKYLLRGCVLVALMALAGCMTPIGVNQVAPRQVYRHLNENALNSDECSADTIRVLHRYDLDKTFEENPDATLEKLQAIACTDERRDLLYALSELTYRNADRQRRSVKPGVSRLARNSYFASAIYAYFYLFGKSDEPSPSPFDLRFRTAGDIYNLGLAQSLVVNTNAQVKLASGPRDTTPGVVQVEFVHADFPWKLNQIQAFYSADEFIVRGLSTRNRDSGLGAPLIAVSDKIGRFREQRRAPATVFLRVSGNARDWSAGKLSAQLELYSAYDATKVDVDGMPVPLQTDTTAPLAQGLDNSPIWNTGVAQFFSAEAAMKTGIRLMQPYSPGKIPVVFVHGTASSPVWWAEMANTLRADPIIREHYQFWMFNYASGLPITYSAGILRNDLTETAKFLDPKGKDTALQRMVVIGHSQGGLLAKLTATDTGDKLWRLVSPTSIDQLQIDEPTRELLRTNFFFKPLPCVARVIFIATPHRGSYRNSRFLQKILNSFMTIPKEMVNDFGSVLKLKNTIRLPASVRDGVPSSLASMDTDNPFMLTLADIPVAPGVKANSVIAIQGDEQPPKGSDGVVEYTSAHVDYAESEFIVRDGHSCQGNPLTIDEIRRILMKNLGNATAPAGVGEK